MTNNPQAKLQPKLELYIKKRGTITGIQRKKIGEISGEGFDAPRSSSLALMRPVLSPITGRAWVARVWGRDGAVHAREAACRQSPAGYTETGIVGKNHLDITTTLLY